MTSPLVGEQLVLRSDLGLLINQISVALLMVVVFIIFLNPMKLYSNIIYVFSTIQRLILNLVKKVLTKICDYRQVFEHSTISILVLPKKTLYMTVIICTETILCSDEAIRLPFSI